MNEEQDNLTPLPTINAQTFNNYKAELFYSHPLPSDGFVNRYDPEGGFIAIGCNNGERLLYCLKESILFEIIDKIIEQAEDPSEIPVTCIRF